MCRVCKMCGPCKMCGVCKMKIDFEDVLLHLVDLLKELYTEAMIGKARFEETVSTARPPSDFPNLLRDVDNRLGDVDTLMKKTSYHFQMRITYEYLRMSEEELLEGKKLYLRMSEEELLEGKKLLLEGKKLLLDVKKLLLVGFCTLPSLSDSDCTLPSLSYLEKRMSDVKKQVSDALDLLDGTDYIIAIARIQETFLRVYTAWPKEIEELKNIFFHGLPFDFDFDRNRNLPKSTVRGAGHGGKMSTVINWDRILGKYEERTIVLNWEDESTFFSPLSVYFLKMELSGLKKELSDLKDMSIFKDEQLFDATDVLDLLDQLKALYIGVTNCRARFEETVSTARPPSDFPNLLRDVDNRLGDVDTLMKKTSYHFEMGITYLLKSLSFARFWYSSQYLRMSEEELLEGKKLLLDVKKLLLVGFCTLPSLSDSDCTLPSLSYLEKRMSDVKKQVSDLKDKQLSDALDLLDGTDYIIAIAMIRETFLWVYTAWPRSGLLMGITRPEERINFGHETRLFFSLDFTSLFYLVKRMSDLKKQASDLNHKQLLDALDLLDETVSMHIIAIISRETRVFGEPGLFGETVYTARPPSDLLKRLFDLCVRHDEAVSDTDLVKETGFEGIIFFHGLPFDFDFDFDRNLPKSTVRGAGHGGKMMCRKTRPRPLSASKTRRPSDAVLDSDRNCSPKQFLLKESDRANQFLQTNVDRGLEIISDHGIERSFSNLHEIVIGNDAPNRLPACKARFNRNPPKSTVRGAGHGGKMMSEAAMYYPPMSSDFEKLSSPLLFERPPCPKWIRNTALERLNCPKWVLAIRNTALERLNCPKWLLAIRNTALERLNCPKWLLSAASISASYLLVQPTWLLRFVQWCYPSVFFLKSTTEPFVALTIDDAPHVNITPEILNILKDHGCKATFFAIGENLDNDAPDRPLFTRMCKEGHEVANHTMRDFPSWRLSREELRKELSETDRRIRPIGKDPTVQDLKWFRPGHGFFNEGMIAEAEAQGYRVALGSIYPWDTLFTAQGSLLSQSILRRIHPGAVIVLHDREPQKEQTLQILKTILPELKAKGYHVVTLSHLHSLTSPPVTISSSSESDIVMKTGTQRWSWCQRVSMNVVMDTVKETFTRWWSRFQQVSMTVVMGNGDSKRDIYSKVV